MLDYTPESKGQLLVFAGVGQLPRSTQLVLMLPETETQIAVKRML